MGTLYVLVLAVACLSVQAFPENPVPYKNTIFGEERIEGGAFEHIDDFKDLAVTGRSTNNPYRLPTTTKPSHYKVLWRLDMNTLSLSGLVQIELQATQSNVNEIVIHVNELDLQSVDLFLGQTENQPVPIETYTLVPEYHFLKVKILNGVLQYNANTPVIYTLKIAFSAPLRTDMYGIYRSWYRNEPTDEVSWMASTQFQATAARSAFPCYDEPSFKATFDVTIRRPSTYKSWFCTLPSGTTPNVEPGYTDDHYHTTPVMSTYLLALIVAEYESISHVVNNVLTYEVIARPNAIKTGQGQYAFDVGMKLLDEMSNHTDYDFYSQHEHLKMTQAAIPDFGAGAMENWGLLTYREAYLLHDEVHTNGYFKQLIAYILSHEIAHMWFGNLVTCDWWDVLWLNEGFARYYQYFLTDWIEDYMGLGDRFINEQIHSILLTDSSDNPQPLNNPGVGSPAQVSAMFATISYNKGAAVIRMTEHLMGFDAHEKGLRQYLVDRKFNTALPIHLFQTLQNTAVETGAIAEYGPNFNIIDYYKTWTDQPGHPVLNVQVDHSTGLMTVYQRRFNINSGYSTSNTNWIVPVTFATASDPDFNNTKPTHIISDAITVIDRKSVGDEWVIFNKQQTGYYRVNYDDYTWDLIAKALKGPERTTIHEYNRAQIVNDVLQFARSGLMSYNKALNILTFLQDEINYTPWVTAFTGLNWIRNRLKGTPLAADLDARLALIVNTATCTHGYLPVPDEPFMRSYMRYQLVPFVCSLDIDFNPCADAAEYQFADLRNGVAGYEVPADNRNWVYCNVLRQGSVADFNFLWQRFLNHNVYTEKILLLQALGCTPDEQSLFTFLDAIVKDNHIIRPQDYTTAFNAAVNGNEVNTQIVFKYIQQNTADVMKAFPNSPATPFSYVSARLRTIAQVEEFEQWADNNRQTLGTWYQTIRNGAQNSRNSIEWVATVEDDIRSFLQQPEQELTTSTQAPEVVDPPVTVPPPPISEPTSPELPEPDSANTAFLSVLVVALALIANMAL